MRFFGLLYIELSRIMEQVVAHAAQVGEKYYLETCSAHIPSELNTQTPVLLFLFHTNTFLFLADNFLRTPTCVCLCVCVHVYEKTGEEDSSPDVA